MNKLRLLSREWLLASVLVVAGALLCVRLGLWQLDRLEQRREFNRQVVAMRALPVLDLDTGSVVGLPNMEWRQARVSGHYDPQHQVVLRNQYLSGEHGFHLITPLVLRGGQAILVDRGWIPALGNQAPKDWRKYDQLGTLSVEGQLRLASRKPAFGGVADPTGTPGGGRLDAWNNLDLDRIGGQIPYPILPVYLQADPSSNETSPPIAYQPEIELSEGSHMGYALQWFAFAGIFLVGYPFYVRSHINRKTG